jgi:UDP-2-acetamido-2,6-beta-L-arabino-hexul-4-ose reductase
MIIGNGMMAKAFKYYNNKEVVIFASGVSNSLEEREECFEREKKILFEAIEMNRTIVYFSTCSIYDETVNDSKYVHHKLYMEYLIKKRCNKFYIFRLPQVVGRTNSPTLINFLYNQINDNKTIDVNRYSTRNIISVRTVFEFSQYMIDNEIYINEITNIATPYNTSVIDIISIMEETLNKKSFVRMLNKGKIQNIDVSKIKKLSVYKKSITSDYVKKIISQYIKMRELLPSS